MPIFGCSTAATSTVKESCFWQPNWLSTLKYKLYVPGNELLNIGFGILFELKLFEGCQLNK